MSSFHRIENYGNNHIKGAFLELSFDTEYRGYWQCRVTNTGLSEYSSEPPFESLKADEQKEIKEVAGIVFYLTHDEWPEGLSAFST